LLLLLHLVSLFIWILLRRRRLLLLLRRRRRRRLLLLLLLLSQLLLKAEKLIELDSFNLHLMHGLLCSNSRRNKFCGR
jgi:hypothetical protein